MTSTQANIPLHSLSPVNPNIRRSIAGRTDGKGRLLSHSIEDFHMQTAERPSTPDSASSTHSNAQYELFRETSNPSTSVSSTHQELKGVGGNGHPEDSRIRKLPSPTRLNKMTILLAAWTFLWLIPTILYLSGSATTTGFLTRLVPDSYSLSVNILRILTEICGILLAALCNSVIQLVSWRLVSSSGGLPLSSMLAMSPASNVSALLKLMRWESPKGNHHRYWILLRFFIIGLGLLLSLLPTSELTSIAAFKVQSTVYPVSAGVAPFNASLAPQWSGNVLSLSLLSENFDLFQDHYFTTIPVTPAVSACFGTDCKTHFYTGGLKAIRPDPILLTQSPQADIIIVVAEAGVQADFWDVSSSEAPITPENCQKWGSQHGALMVCLKSSSLDPSNILAGLSWCSADMELDCFTNTTWAESFMVSNTLAFSSRTSNSVYSRSNGSLLTVQDISQPKQNPINPSALLFTLGQFFYDSHLVDSNSTITAVISYITTILSSGQPDFGGQALVETFFQGFLMLPLLVFQANNPNNTLQSDPIPNLPPDLYVSLELARLGNRLLIAPWTAVLYAILASMICLTCIGLLVWGLQKQGPNISDYPLVDFAARVCAGGRDEDSLACVFAKTASTTELQQHLKDIHLYLRVWSVKEPGHGGVAEEIDVKTMGFKKVSGDSLIMGKGTHYL